MTLFMLKGLPAAGKSVWAKDYLKAHGNAKIVNKDLLRLMLDNGEWSSANEKLVLKIRNVLIEKILGEGMDVIVDDTNLAPKHAAALEQLAKMHGAKFEVIDLTGVSLEECIKRDRGRANYVGEDVIRKMYNQFLKPKPPEPPPHNFDLPDAVLVDIDGTLAEMVDRGPFEWGKVYSDRVRGIVADTVKLLARGTGAKIIVVSGRDAVCAEDTIRWLQTKCWPESPYHALYMRPRGDMRKDSLVKKEIYDKYINGKYNIISIFDDRAQVCRTWSELGFGDRLFRVGPVDGDDF